MLSIGDKFPNGGKTNIYDFNNPEEAVLDGDKIAYAGDLPVEILRMTVHAESEGFGDTLVTSYYMYKPVWSRSNVSAPEFEHRTALDGLRRMNSMNSPMNKRMGVRVSAQDIDRMNNDRSAFGGTDKELLDAYEAWLESLRNPPYSYLNPYGDTEIELLRGTKAGRAVWSYHITSIVPASKG